MSMSCHLLKLVLSSGKLNNYIPVIVMVQTRLTCLEFPSECDDNNYYKCTTGTRDNANTLSFFSLPSVYTLFKEYNAELYGISSKLIQQIENNVCDKNKSFRVLCFMQLHQASQK